MHYIMWECNSIVRECNTIVRECNTIVGECNSIVRECNSIVRECNSIVRGCNSMVRECSSIAREYNSIARERNSLQVNAMKTFSCPNQASATLTVHRTISISINSATCLISDILWRILARWLASVDWICLTFLNVYF